MEGPQSSGINSMREIINKRIAVYTALAVLAVCSLAWSYGNFSSEDAIYLSPITVKLKWIHQSQFAGIYTAIEKGFYEYKMLDVKVVEGSPSSPPIDAVLSGGAKFGIAGADDIIVQVSKGAPLKVIAVIYQKNPIVYFSRKDSGITTPYDFVGKKVGVREGTGSFNIYLSILKDLGIDRSQIEEVPASADLTPFIEGSVDVWPGFIMNEPVTVENSGIEINLIKPENYGIDIYGDVLFTTARVAEREPDLVRSFVRATLMGWEYSIDNQDEAVGYVMRYAKDTTREHQSSILSESVPLIRPDIGTEIGDMSFVDWLGTYNTFEKFGVISEDVDVRDVYTVKFLE